MQIIQNTSFIFVAHLGRVQQLTGRIDRPNGPAYSTGELLNTPLVVRGPGSLSCEKDREDNRNSSFYFIKAICIRPNIKAHSNIDIS